MDIYIAKYGQPTGPYRLHEIQARLDDSAFDGTELAWRDGLDDWIAVRELFIHSYNHNAPFDPLHTHINQAAEGKTSKESEEIPERIDEVPRKTQQKPEGVSIKPDMKNGEVFCLSYEVREWGSEDNSSATNYFWFRTKEEAEKAQDKFNESKKSEDFEYKETYMGGYEIDDGWVKAERIPLGDKDEMLEWLNKNCYAKPNSAAIIELDTDYD